MRIVADIIQYASANMPKFNSISISGYHMHEAGATAVQELAFTLADGMDYVRAAPRQGARRRRLRAAPLLLLRHRHELLHGGGEAARGAPALAPDHDRASARRPSKSKMLRTHCQTSGVSLTEQDPYNNVDPHHDRGDGGGARRHPVACTPTASTRRSRCPPISPPGSPATPSSSSPRKAASPTSPIRSAAPIMSRR